MHKYRLYVMGLTPKAHKAEQEIRRLLEERLPNGFELEVVDVLESPDRVEADRIFATPTLVRHSPLPVAKVLGNLTYSEKLIQRLGLD